MTMLYMVFWSLMMILALSVVRVRMWRQRFLLLGVTAVVLFISQTLFWQMAYNLGVDPNMALTHPQQFLLRGPMGWLALMVMPCGWLGPIIGVHLTERWQMVVGEARR